MLYLALAVACALVGGLGPALAASLLGVLALNYWFTEPLHTLVIASELNVLTLVTFVVVSIAVSSVVDSAARRRAQAIAARAEADTLAGLNRTLLAGEHDTSALLDLVRSTFSAGAAELLSADATVGPNDSVADASRDTVLVLRDVELDPAQRRVLAAFAAHLGVQREREELARQTAAARSSRPATGPGPPSWQLSPTTSARRSPGCAPRPRPCAATTPNFQPPTGRTCWRQSRRPPSGCPAWWRTSST